jgi:uracil-DNA glycosylase family 4
MLTSDLHHNIDKCCRNISGAGRIVMGEGPSDAQIMLIGQNPGAEEDKQGRPFVGRSGKYLNKVLAVNNINRDTLFITSVVKCKTPGNRKPTKNEIKVCLPLLMEQIKSIKPKLIVLMGEVAWQTPRSENIQYIETYHPAAAMRFPGIRAKFEADFQRLGRLLG